MKCLFDSIDIDKNKALNVSEIRAFLSTIGVADKSHKDIEEIFKKYDIDYMNDEGMSFLQFKTWFISTTYYQEKLHCFNKQSECVENIDDILSFPNTFMARFWFILTIPLILLFIYTIPDTRKPGKANYCYFSFLMSIVWIGIFSYFLVE